MDLDSKIIWHSRYKVTWKIPHDAYHVTEMKNIGKIINNGLRAKCGDRSKSVGDKIKAIYFTDSLEGSYDWIKSLYPKNKIEEIVLLKFNLQNRKVYLRNRLNGDFHIKTPKIEPEKIEYLELKYQEEATSLNYLLEALYKERDYRLEWHPLLELKK